MLPAQRHTVVYDSDGQLETNLPLDRATHCALARQVRSWSDHPPLYDTELAQIVQLLAGAVGAVAADVRTATQRIPADHRARALAENVLADAAQQLVNPPADAEWARDLARLLGALYERLDRLTALAAAAHGAE